MNIIGPILSPEVVQAIERKAQPSLFSQIVATAIANKLNRPTVVGATTVAANMAQPAPTNWTPLLLIGALAVGAVILLGGRRG